MNLAEQIRAARGHRSQEAFASEAGCSSKTVARWESGTPPRTNAYVDFLVSKGVDRSDLERARAASVGRVAS